MAIKIGRHVPRRFQGMKSCCWLTCIEMLMQVKEGTIYGKDKDGRARTAHTRNAQQEYNEDKGSFIGRHASEYHLVPATRLREAGLDDWGRALAKGPVLAEGYYATNGLPYALQHKSWLHVILISGISNSDKLVFVNPNACGYNWLHVNRWRPGGSDFGDSYMSLASCLQRAKDNPLGGPFWQHKDDYTKW